MRAIRKRHPYYFPFIFETFHAKKLETADSNSFVFTVNLYGSFHCYLGNDESFECTKEVEVGHSTNYYFYYSTIIIYILSTYTYLLSTITITIYTYVKYHMIRIRMIVIVIVVIVILILLILSSYYYYYYY